MRGIAILLLIVLFFAYCWPFIIRWLKRKAMQKFQDQMLRSMGIDPKAARNGRSSDFQDTGRQRGRRQPGNSAYHNNRRSNEPIIPKEYAEDVEFVETIDYSAEITDGTKDSIFNYHERQVTDVEFTEIKSSSNK